MLKSNYSSDAPIENASQDEFNRFPFAQRVSKIIANRKAESSIVIGIYGAWGEGKTSVFNFIENELKIEENVICIRFNPWRFPDEDTMLLNFFNDLAKAIDRELETKSEKLGRVVEKYINPLAQVAGKGENVAGISKMLSSSDIEDIKIRVEKMLEEERKRVVILIDDIDRLDKNEIHAVFRMVKLTADFKYTAYILAFDKDMVAAALQERYGAQSSRAGILFLEKIIQVPLQLPAIDTTDLTDFCFKAIDEALKVGEIEITEDDVQNFVRQFSTFEGLMKTPRQAMLYSNTLMFSLPILKGEVNMVDLMLIEAIRVFVPEIYMFIRENKEIFLENVSNSLEDKEKRKKIIDEELTILDSKYREDFKSLLKYLFPNLKSVYFNIQYGSDLVLSSELNQRICSEKYFQRYFSYAIPKGDLSDVRINKFLLEMENQSLQESNANFINFIDDKNVKNFISKMRTKVKDISNTKILEDLALIIARHGELYPNPKQLFQFNSTFAQAAMLLGMIVMKQNKSEEKLDLATEIIKYAQPLSFTVEFFRWLRSSKDKEGNKISAVILTSLGKVLGEKIKTHILKDVSLMFTDFRDTLSFWNMYGEQNEAKLIIKGILEKHPDYALNIMKQYLPVTWNSKGLKEDVDLERETYDNLIANILAEDLIAALNKIYPELPIDEEYPEFIECSHDEKIARQFIWLHNFVENECEI